MAFDKIYSSWGNFDLRKNRRKEKISLFLMRILIFSVFGIRMSQILNIEAPFKTYELIPIYIKI
jgi:hypothetical protein